MSLDGSAGWRPSALRRAGHHAHPGLGPLQLVEETASGRLAWREWAVGRLLTATTQSGDVVLCTAERRMAHSTFQELAMSACCRQRGVAVYGAVFGTVTVNSGTSVTYTPTFPMTVAALQKEALSYTVKDTVTGLSSDPATINISINDTAPTAAAFTVSPALPRNQLSTISALSHATSPGNETMTITGVTAATHGSTAITSDMTGVTYTPVAGYAGADSFTYKVTDVLGVASTSGSISLTVTSVNNAPVANGHGYMLNLDNTNYIDFNIGTTGSSGQVLLNDYDPDNDPIFLTSVSNVTGYVVASVISSTVIEIGCTATLGQGSFTYTISDGFTTSSATITGQCKTGTGTQ